MGLRKEQVELGVRAAWLSPLVNKALQLLALFFLPIVGTSSW